jgi:hypothetical protein
MVCEPLATLALIWEILEQVFGCDVLAVPNSIVWLHQILTQQQEIHDTTLALFFEDALWQRLLFESFVEVFLPQKRFEFVFFWLFVGL